MISYQLPALLLPHTTLVISPLIALMKDQVDALSARHKRAAFINSTLSADEQQSRLRMLARGWYKIVYVAPERLRSADFLAALKQTRVALLLDYFGDRGGADAPDCCDNHVENAPHAPRRAQGGAEWIPRVLLEAVRTVKRPLGRDKIAQIAHGSRARYFAMGARPPSFTANSSA